MKILSHYYRYFTFTAGVITLPIILLFIVKLAGSITVCCSVLPQNNSVEYIFYKIDDIYVVETCVENLKEHFIQFSRKKAILEDYENIGVYDLLCTRHNNPIYNPETDTLDNRIFDFNNSGRNNICIDLQNNTVYHSVLLNFSHDFDMVPVSSQIHPDSALRSFKPCEGMVAFSFPAKTGHLRKGSENMNFSLLGYRRGTMSKKEVTRLRDFLNDITGRTVVFSHDIVAEEDYYRNYHRRMDSLEEINARRYEALYNLRKKDQLMKLRKSMKHNEIHR